VRALHQPWLRQTFADETAVFAWAIVLPIASAASSLIAIALGLRRWSGRALVADTISLAGVYVLVFLLSQGEHLSYDAAFGILGLALVARAAAPLAVIARAVPFPTLAVDDRRATIAFVIASAALIALLVAWPLPSGCHLGCSMRSRWVPFGLLLATGLTLALARAARPAAALPLLARGASLWLAVPVAFALTGWTGAPDGFVGVPVIALVVGIAAQGVLTLYRAAEVHGDRATGALLGATVLAASLALLPWVRTVQPTQSDEPHYLVAMQSLVEDHDLDLKNEYDRADYADYYPTPLEARHIVEVGSTEVPIHDLGLPLLGAIPFALGRRTGVLAFMCVVVALFAWRGFHLLRRLGFRRDSAILAVSGVSLLHPLFTYTTQIYPDAIGALAMLLAAEQLAAPITPRRLAMASALLGVLPWLSARLWFVALGMGLVVAALAFAPLFAGGLGGRRGRARDVLVHVLAGAVPFAVVVGAYAWVDLALFGVPVPNAGYFVIRDQYYVVAYTPWIGLPGLFLDRTFGLLSHAPIYLVSLVGLVPLWRRWRAAPSPAIAALFLGWLVYLLYVGDIFYWWADGAPSSRYLLGSIAFVLVALAAGIERMRGAIALSLAAIAAAWSVCVTLLYALVPNVRYDIVADIRPDGGPGFLWVVVTKVLRADPGILFPSMVRAAPLDYALAAAWLVILATVVFAGSRPPRAAPARAAYSA
jgi:hypothetical protein